MRYSVIIMVKLNLDFSDSIKYLKYYIKKKKFAVGPRGNYLSFYKGESTDFYGFRKYRPDDDSKMIDWKATARVGKLMVREFTQEKGLHFLVMLDTSASMFFSSSEKLKCEFAAEVAAAISFSVAYTGNSIGLCVFNNGVKKIIEPKPGMTQYHRILSLLQDEKYYGGNRNYNKSFSYLLKTIKKNTIIYIISDFFEFTKNNEELVTSLTGRYEIVGIMIRDIAEYKLPKIGQICIEDPKTGEKLLINSSDIADEYFDEIKNQEEKILNIFLRNNLFIHKMYNNENINEALARIYSVRGR
jgi:uncharacterized protein (DUF58 family)